VLGKGRFHSGFLVGKLARDIKGSFRINRLYAGSSPLLGTNFPYFFTVIRVLFKVIWSRPHGELMFRGPLSKPTEILTPLSNAVPIVCVPAASED
jgi:hypothetical protein